MTRVSRRKTGHYSGRSQQLVPYGVLHVGMRFKVKGSDHTFIKLASSNALDDNTGKDAIFAGHDKCEPLGLQEGYYPIWSLL